MQHCRAAAHTAVYDNILGRLLANQGKIEKRLEQRLVHVSMQIEAVEALANSILLRLAQLELEHQHRALNASERENRRRQA